MTNRIHMAEIVDSAIKSLEEHKTARLGYYALRQFLPYLIRKIGDKWLPLNRDYKPLGLGAGVWANYADYAHMGLPDDLITVPDLGHKEALGYKGDSFCDYTDNGYLYFFSDGCTPINATDRQKYVERVKKGFLRAYRVTAIPA